MIWILHECANSHNHTHRCIPHMLSQTVTGSSIRLPGTCTMYNTCACKDSLCNLLTCLLACMIDTHIRWRLSRRSQPLLSCLIFETRHGFETLFKEHILIWKGARSLKGAQTILQKYCFCTVFFLKGCRRGTISIHVLVSVYIYIYISKDSSAISHEPKWSLWCCTFNAALLEKTMGLEYCSRAVAFSTDCIFSTKYCILEMKTAPCKEDNASCKASGLLFKEYCISQIEAASLKKAVLFQNQTCFKETLHMRMQREYGYGIFSRHTSLFCMGRGIPFRGKHMLQNYCLNNVLGWGHPAVLAEILPDIAYVEWPLLMHRLRAY